MVSHDYDDDIDNNDDYDDDNHDHKVVKTGRLPILYLIVSTIHRHVFCKEIPLCMMHGFSRYHPPDGEFPGHEVFKMVGELEKGIYLARGVQNM